MNIGSKEDGCATAHRRFLSEISKYLLLCFFTICDGKKAQQ